jgi:hypothetical protein
MNFFLRVAKLLVLTTPLNGGVAPMAYPAVLRALVPQSGCFLATTISPSGAG